MIDKPSDKMVIPKLEVEELTCRVQFLNDMDPFSCWSDAPSPGKFLQHSFNMTLPLSYQLPAVHRVLRAPHRVIKIDYYYSDSFEYGVSIYWEQCLFFGCKVLVRLRKAPISSNYINSGGCEKCLEFVFPSVMLKHLKSSFVFTITASEI